MANKKTITQSKIISIYMDYILQHNHKPKSVYAFAKHNKFEESEFYSYFGSFDAVEKEIFKLFHTNTLNMLNKNEDYKSFDARNKLLSYYFTFFENLTANRSYVIYALNQHKNTLKSLSLLNDLKNSFIIFIERLDIETLDIKQEQFEKIQNRAIKESAWLQLLATIKFWMEDTSASFEKTDVFIEKSVNTSFDILNTTPLKSIIDFGKFLFKEKMYMN